ncbi:MAG: cation diffusion facilitator family transporter [Halolamina sp.]|uniref:cation diffusion facilitator family transporter n=1 Tax=Halolamina sp. TaxID=1940283 RepID=UPI002FC3A3AE
MERKQVVRRVGLVVLVANAALALAKAGFWLETGSLALGSEAVNSAADALYSAVVVAGLYLTTRPPDFEHPHGHERIEPFVALFVAVGVFGAGIGVIWTGTASLVEGSYAATSPLAAVVLGAGAIAKYGLYRYCLGVGEEHRSPALIATAKDNRTDVLTALAALVGAGGAAVGFPVLDPVAAVVVGGGILLTGVDIVRDNLDYLVGAAPPESLRDDIVAAALEQPEVEGAHDVIAHYVGPEVDVSLHIEVQGDLTIREAHDIETDVINAIREIPEVDDAFVHVDPKELGEWKEGKWRDEREGAT